MSRYQAQRKRSVELKQTNENQRRYPEKLYCTEIKNIEESFKNSKIYEWNKDKY